MDNKKTSKMDVDNENFYEEISSFMPEPGDYSLEDLDDIIRLTDSNLNTSFDINAFANSFDQNEFDMQLSGQNEYVFKEKNEIEDKTENNFENNSNVSAGSSPETLNQSDGYSSQYETSVHTSSTSSIDGDHFNPDDFINFLNDDDIKIDDMMTDDANLKINVNCRNTPSPTGSCTSSSGSSTSGVQSDASSVASITQNYKCTMKQDQDDDLLEFLQFKNEKSDGDMNKNETSILQPHISAQQFENSSVLEATVDSSVNDDKMSVTTKPASSTVVPITLSVLPVTTIHSVAPVNFMQGTIFPAQTVPVANVNPVVDIKTPTFKNDTKPHTVKSDATSFVKSVENTTATAGSPKVTPPSNTKPKTIFLSSNDFKALMQKVNTNGKKITGFKGQMPKIIMKTANGKVITANKLTCSNSNSSFSTSGISNASTPTSSNSLQFVSKLLKTGPITVKQQPSKVVTTDTRSAAIMASTRATLGQTKSCRADSTMFKNLNNDKLLKKQLRMLKNRESASLSRKKKKEYVESLENRISNLEKENYSLKAENSSLRSQLMAFAQTCNCKHRNVSEFILNTLNINEKQSGTVFNGIDTSYLQHNSNCNQHLDNCTKATKMYGSTTATHHVKIAPKPANAGQFINKGFSRQRMNSATVKKNVAVLLAMAFMVTLNVGNFQTYLNKSALEGALETSVSDANEEPLIQTSRRLLWVRNEHEFLEHTNRSKRETEMANMPPPPLHFLRPVNRTTANKLNGTSAKYEPPLMAETKTTTTYVNNTLENMRLARNLHKWIGGNDYLNLTGTRNENDYEHMSHFKFGSGSYMNYDLSIEAPIGMKQKRKIILDSETPEKHKKLNIGDDNDSKSLDIFKPRISEEYLKLFRGIKRQDDTFYVLSFNMDHILLPASSYNKSSRPKMSLMLPAGDPSINGDIVLMQIDCEVINTTELNIKSYMIPEKLRPTKYSSSVRVNPNDVVNNETSVPASSTKSKEIPLRKEELKEKPSAPRTYFMMGPKNQAPTTLFNSISAGTNVKRNPPIVKLNANDSVIGSGVLNVRNSTLFSRMRETVSYRYNGYVAPSNIKKLL